jgi:hypothetical protein
MVQFPCPSPVGAAPTPHRAAAGQPRSVWSAHVMESTAAARRWQSAAITGR